MTQDLFRSIPRLPSPCAHRAPSRTRVRLIVAIATLALALAACSRQPPPPRDDQSDYAVPVAARPAERGSLRAVVRASAVVVPADGAEFVLVAPEPARILELTKVVGDAVSSGEMLVRFELTGATEDLARQRAELARVQAQVENARAAHARVRDFVARGLVPRLELDAAERELADAQSTAERTQAAFTAAERAVARAIVRAPFSGVVATRLHNPGDLVQAAVTDPILRIVDPSRMEVVASVEAADAARVLPGASARMAHPTDGSSIPLSLTGRLAGSAGGTVLVRLVSASPLAMTVDTRVAVEIDAEERTDVVFVTPEMLLQDRGQTIVMIAAGDRAERRVVTTGVTTDVHVEITSGLRAGELIITQGHVGLQDGTMITVAVTAAEHSPGHEAGPGPLRR